MSKRVTGIVAVVALALAVTTDPSEAFAPATFMSRTALVTTTSLTPRFAEETKEASGQPEAAFVPSEPAEQEGDDAVEKLERGSAKVSVMSSKSRSGSGSTCI